MKRFLILFFLVVISSFGGNNFDSFFGNEKKDRFTANILPVILEENENILKDRAFVESFFSKNFFLKLNSPHRAMNIKKLASIANKYKVKNLYNKDEYLKKIDIVPPSMAMGQAVLESGWGTSAYAKNLNNYYGHYVFNKRLKVKLKGKSVSGKDENIRIFESIADSVRAYMLNLNTHLAYKAFREARAEERQHGEMISGLESIQYMQKYSILKNRYINMVSSIIKSNDLSIFDTMVTDIKQPNFKNYVKLQ